MLPVVEGSWTRNHDPKRTCRLPGLASRFRVIGMHEGAIGTLGFNAYRGRISLPTQERAMTEHFRTDGASMDSQAFAAVLAAVFVCTLLWVIATVVGEMPEEPVAIAMAPSQLRSPRL